MGIIMTHYKELYYTTSIVDASQCSFWRLNSMYKHLQNCRNRWISFKCAWFLSQPKPVSWWCQATNHPRRKDLLQQKGNFFKDFRPLLDEVVFESEQETEYTKSIKIQTWDKQFKHLTESFPPYESLCSQNSSEHVTEPCFCRGKRRVSHRIHVKSSSGLHCAVSLGGSCLNQPRSATSAARLPGFLGPFPPASMKTMRVENGADSRWLRWGCVG